MTRPDTRRFTLLLALLALVLGGCGTVSRAATRAQWDYEHNEFVIISGGPSLARWEGLRPDPHDRYWGNFVRAARIRMDSIRRAHGDAAQITWLVYRRGYIDREAEEKVPCIANIMSVRDKYRVALIWIDSGDDIVRYINNGRPRNQVKICNLEYFGHSNRDCWMLDYSCEISGASRSFLHEDYLGPIRSGAFSKNAYCKSWGCHTAESMSARWKKATGLTLVGAMGKTDYSPISFGNLPGLSPGGYWKE